MYRFHFLSYIIKDMKFTIRENVEIKMNVNNPNRCNHY